VKPTEIVNIEVKKKYKRKMYPEIARSAHLYREMDLDSEANHMIAVSCIVDRNADELTRILKHIHIKKQTCKTTAIILQKISGYRRSKFYQRLMDHSAYSETKYMHIDEHLITLRDELCMTEEGYIEIRAHEDIPCWPLKAEEHDEVLVVCWNASVNAMGRAAVLCETVIESGKKVELLGLCKNDNILEIWRPILETKREYNIKVITYKDRQDLFKKIVEYGKEHRYDLIWTSKIRYESLIVGIIYKVMYGTMIMADVDEFESSFNTTGIELADARRLAKRALTSRELEELAKSQGTKTIGWNLYAERMVDMYDKVTAASENLKIQYGNNGIVLRHIRNTNQQSERLINTSSECISILFNGTIRKHKGLDQLIEVLTELTDAGQKIELYLYQQPMSNEFKKNNKNQRLNIVEIKNVQYSENISICKNFDFVCVPQDSQNSISKYQTPAKISDAILAGTKLIACKTPPIQELINNGVQIETIEMKKESFIKALCNCKKANEPELDKSLFSVKNIPGELREIISSRCSSPEATKKEMSQEIVKELEMALVIDITKEIGVSNWLKKESVEVVVLWRQSDTGDYPRRQHAITRRLSQDTRIKHVHHFEPPICKDSLGSHKHKNRVLERYKGIIESEKLRYHTYIYEKIKIQEKSGVNFQSIEWYPEFIEKRILCTGKSKKRILWIYPPYPEIGNIISKLEHNIIVVDIVDNVLVEHDPSSIDYEYTISQYKYFAKAADMIIVNCQPMADLFEKLGGGERITLVENGYPATNEPTTMRFKGPVKKCIYTGNMNGRIDWNLLRNLSKQMPDIRIELYGEANDDISWLIRDCPNIEIKGIAKQDNIGKLFNEFSIAIVPHISNEKTKYMNPIKIYQYLSLGIPIISSCELNIPKTRNLIIAKTVDKFKEGIRSIEEKRKMGNDNSESMKGFLESNSWDTRMKEIWKRLDALMQEDK
jgi:glycosyltransferase involved in cell wall biosynthesis